MQNQSVIIFFEALSDQSTFKSVNILWPIFQEMKAPETHNAIPYQDKRLEQLSRHSSPFDKHCPNRNLIRAVISLKQSNADSPFSATMPACSEGKSITPTLLPCPKRANLHASPKCPSFSIATCYLTMRQRSRPFSEENLGVTQSKSETLPCQQRIKGTLTSRRNPSRKANIEAVKPFLCEPRRMYWWYFPIRVVLFPLTYSTLNLASLEAKCSVGYFVSVTVVLLQITLCWAVGVVYVCDEPDVPVCTCIFDYSRWKSLIEGERNVIKCKPRFICFRCRKIDYYLGGEKNLVGETKWKKKKPSVSPLRRKNHKWMACESCEW